MALIFLPDIKVYGANTGPTWGRQDPGGPHVGAMNFAIWDYIHGFSGIANENNFYFSQYSKKKLYIIFLFSWTPY